MKKFRVLAFVLAIFTTVCFTSEGVIASATTKKTTSRTTKVAAKKKTATKPKTTAQKKTVAKPKTTIKKTAAKKPVTKKATTKKVSATTKKVAAKKKVAVKTTAKKSSSKTRAKKAYTKSTKKKLTASRKSTSRRRKAYSRGSGSTLGDGNVAKMINYAKRYLGVDYNYGRSSSSGFDCSGFTMFVYRNVDVDLPHSAAGQANLGLAVEKSQLKAGDLVFFETVRSGISHVGIYIGNNHFIHASSGVGHVTISSLSEDYYAPRFRGATRILNN